MRRRTGAARWKSLNGQIFAPHDASPKPIQLK
jgi:hypothetical protein